MNKQAFVYIITNKVNTVLYTEVTSDLVKLVGANNEPTREIATSPAAFKRGSSQ